MTLPSLAALLALALLGEPVQDVRLAVVAGNDRGLDSEQPLEFAEADARRVHAVLTELGGIAPSRAALVLGGGPEELLRALEAMAGQARALGDGTPVAVILYVSAHADEESLHLGGRRLELAAVLAALRRAPAHLRLLVTDTCRTPVAARGKGGRPGPEEPVVLDQSARVDGEVLLAATGPGELAQEWSHLRGALFTHHLVAGLRGAADLDGDGRVTLAEAYAFAFRATSTRAAEAGRLPQKPSFDLRLAGFGDWVFTRLDAAGAELSLGGELAGRIWVSEQRGGVVAEVDKRAGEPLRLALPAGTYRVARLSGEWAEAADVNLAFGGRRRVGGGDLVRVRAERAVAKGGPTLTLRPWRLDAGWSMGSPSGAGLPPQQAVEVGLQRAGPGWAARLALGAAWLEADADRAGLSQRELRLAASATWTFPLGPATAGFGVEARPRAIRQRLHRPAEIERAFGALPRLTALALAAGPLATGTLPVGDRGAVELDATFGVEWAPDQYGQAQTRTFVQARLLLGWSF